MAPEIDQTPSDADRAWHAANQSGGWVENGDNPHELCYWTVSAWDWFSALAEGCPTVEF